MRLAQGSIPRGAPGGRVRRRAGSRRQESPRPGDRATPRGDRKSGSDRGSPGGCRPAPAHDGRPIREPVSDQVRAGQETGKAGARQRGDHEVRHQADGVPPPPTRQVRPPDRGDRLPGVRDSPRIVEVDVTVARKRKSIGSSGGVRECSHSQAPATPPERPGVGLAESLLKPPPAEGRRRRQDRRRVDLRLGDLIDVRTRRNKNSEGRRPSAACIPSRPHPLARDGRGPLAP